jgi:pimeloyl-ACP methyl ester carboxylesterase
MTGETGFAGPIHWTSTGSGDPVVLLHGLGGDLSFWGPEIEGWSSQFRVIAVDLRGSGATPGSGREFAIADLADDIVAVLDEAGVSRTHLVGFSTGGLVAQDFALRHPDRLDRLVLVSTFARLHRQVELFLDAVLAVYEQHGSAQQTFDLLCPWLYSPSFIVDPRNAPYFAASAQAERTQSVDDWRALYRAVQAFDSRSRVSGIRAPTLVIAGELDALAPVGDSKTLASSIPGARLVIFVGSGHVVNAEEPERFGAEVAGFLTPKG